MAGVASMVMASCGGESAHDSDGGAAKGAGGTNAGSGNGKSGTSGSAGRVNNAGRSGSGGTSATRGGGSGRGGSHEGGDGAQEVGGGAQEGGAGSHDGSGGSHVAGTGGSAVENQGGAGMGSTPVNPPKVHACGNPSAWSANLELCDHGFVHRTNDAACPLPPHLGEGGDGGASGAGSFELGPHHGECESDSECAANQYCVVESAIHDDQETHCQSACATNADCASGEVCSCNPTFVSAMNGEALTLGVCAPAGCQTDADCASGTLCVAVLGPDRIWTGCEADSLVVDQFQCQSKRDECSGPDDCDVAHTGEAGAGPTDRVSCGYASGHRTCTEGGIHPECVW
ncbi:MAG TPA: hypothetical protein VNN72_12755 [Polyangiaceae bacterium]|nr:hypothetical protein [Polyangiaceae bacterium]